MSEPRFNLWSANSPQFTTFPRFLLEQAGQTWTESTDRDIHFSAKELTRHRGHIAIHFAPPFLEDREIGREISSLPAIVLYLLDTLEMKCDRVDSMRIVGDAMDLFAAIDAAKIETQTTNDRAWAGFKYGALQDWMRMHNAWLHTRTHWEVEATLLAALWIPLCDFFPTLWPILKREAESLHSLAHQLGEVPGFKKHRQLEDLETRAYVDPFRDGSLRHIDDAAGPEPDPIHDFVPIDWDA